MRESAKMISMLLGVVFLFSQLSVEALSSCNYKYLDDLSGSVNSKIWSGISVTKPIIEQDLGFLYSEEGIDRRYANPTDFQALYAKLTSEIDSQSFAEFARNCKELYEAPESQAKKRMAIFLLLEKSSEKYLKSQKQLEKHSRLAGDSSRRTFSHDAVGRYSDADSVLQLFSSLSGGKVAQ